jgi:predicted  nucleic acid-binding Zn-ribbon protein
MRGAVFLCVALSTVLATHAADVTPIEKVVEMMDGMLAKGKAEKHEEEVEFAKFHEWCDQVRDEKTKSIAEATAQIEELAAAIDKAESDAEVLTEEIATLQKETAKLEADVDSATAQRKTEKTDYNAAHKDLSESIDAVARAIQVLKQREADVPQSLLQVSTLSGVSAQEKAIINSFLAFQSSDSVGAPEANAYEFQSGGVVSLLEKLKLKFEDQRLALEKEEMTSKANYEVLMQQMTDDIKANNKAIEKKTATKAKRLQDAATAKADKQTTEASKAKDEQVLSDTNAECKQTSDEYEKNQVVRIGEIKALSKAIEIISSGDVAGMGDKHLPAALIQTKASAFPQLRSSSDPVRQRVVEFLQGRAQKLGSKYLALIATRASADPFGKVKKMIKDLIVKLMEEANAEADQHAYCETEMATNKQTREIKSSEVEELTAELESQNALKEKLTTEITQLSDEVAEIKKQQKEATDIRLAEKKTNEATIADAKVAQSAIEKATTVLKEFYSSVAASSAALVQNQDTVGLKQEMTEAASLDPYKGQQSGSGGVMGMLEVILSDFARLETETAEAESSAASTYEKFMDESNEDVAVKETEIEHKSNKKDTAVETIASLEKNLKLTQEELDKALEYYEKLKAECVDLGVSYEERVKMREEEIQSLQEALKVLAGEDLGF